MAKQEGTVQIVSLDDPRFEGLTDKQRTFCIRYCLHFNATRAAIEAGYSEKTAHDSGMENLKKPVLKSFIDAVRANTAQAAEISKLRIIEELKKVAFANIADIKSDWGVNKPWAELTEDEKAALAEIDYTKDFLSGGSGEEAITRERMRVKQHDKLKAMEMLSKLLGYNEPEKITHTGAANVTVIRFTGEDDSDNGDNNKP